YLCLDDSAEKAMRLLGKGEQEKAFFTLLDLRGARQRQFERLLENERTLTWNGALEILSPGGEGNYFLYRFSDPTFLCGQAVVQAVGRDQRRLPGPVLDLCGGAGHLTRSLCRLAGARQVILADNTFWEVWLARRFLAPSCQPVCCDANHPLPFARDSFSLVLSSDPFPYVCPHRLLPS